MAPITTARLATCVVAATLVSAAAATLPKEALADDGPASMPSAPVTAPSLDTGAVLAGEASAAVEDAIGDALGEAAQATEQAAPADATSTAAPSAATPVETVPAAETAPVQAPSAARYHAGCVRYRGWYRHSGHDSGSGSGDGGAGLADQRQRQRPDREPRRQRARHAGECRGGRHVGRERHQCRREHSAHAHRGRAEHDVRRARRDAGIATHRGLVLDRARRSGDVDLAMELPVDAGSFCDTARGIYDRIASEELDMDLELR